MSILMRNRKKDDKQAMRAPMVTGEGSLPETPLPWAQMKTSWAVTLSGALPTRPKKSCSMLE